MTRDIHADTLTALSGETLAPIGMVELSFSSGWVRMWTGIGELVWGGNTYYGAGALGQIGAIEETIEIRATGLELAITGLPVDLTAADGRRISEIALKESWQGREANVYLAVLNGRSFEGEPVQVFGGVMDQMKLSEGTIILSCETDLIDLERTRTRYYTSADQRGEYPDDAGCDAVAAVAALTEVKWGRGFEKD